ncbi:hybrid sensor histidine kinase/response regulator [Marinomonas sp. IMCC 4694]|uniref:hybrid sensor histidine kinase/response regulator n=1 Tax=Marinomonas sp. IMCC 4694 TaxID=2605432 RepID=UPI00165333B6|nr:hybrid sensor histidine kinase/response regulator [Marinomonas sp. IMCC 4694]
MLILPFVLAVSVVLTYLDFERRESSSTAKVISDVNRVYSTADAILNTFYWESVDTTIGVTFQGIQKNIFENFVENSENYIEIDAIFRNSFELNQSVSQIRWIDKSGFERYRMNRDSSENLAQNVYVVSPEELQDKSERYYFTETRKLESGYIYLSKLDLNIENGEITTPYQPTIRLATPVRNDQNEFQGIIIINFNLNDMFATLTEIPSQGINIDIFNGSGDLRYSNTLPEVTFLDIIKDNVLSVGIEKVKNYYEKVEEFNKVSTSKNTNAFYAFGNIEYAPQVRVQENISLLVSVQESQVSKISRKNLIESLMIGLVTLLLGFLLIFLLYRADKKVVTLNVELSKQLRISEKSREVKSQFLANMSHEIRTPMTAISGLLELLLKEKLDDHVYKRLYIIKESSDGLRRIINDILDLSKIESGKSILSEAEFRPSLTVERCISTFNGSASLNGSEILLDMDPGLFFYYCLGDEYRIEQVINNLLSNAIKFSDNKPITISVRAEISPDETLELICSVMDGGIGMPESLVKTLGETFTQADNTVSKDNQGTGLGLSISKALLRSMGSDLQIKSELGKGSEFSFQINLPVTKRTSVFNLDKMNIDTLNVWLVNQNNKNSEFIKKLFNHWGCKATAIQTKEQLDSTVTELIENNLALDFILFDLEHAVTENDILYIVDRFTSDRINNTKLVLMTSDESKIKNYAGLNVHVDLLKKPITISGFLELLQTLKLVPNIQAIEDNENDIVKTLERNIIERVKREGQPKILLVEDNLTNQSVISEIFKSIDINVVVASNGKEAVDLVMSQSFDMIFMDVQMPVMSGLEATKIIRERFNMEEMPIIALSAGVTEQEFHKSSNVGMNTHVPKPIDLNKLMHVVIEFWPEKMKEVGLGHLTTEQQAVASTVGNEVINRTSSKVEDLNRLDRFDLSNTVYQWLGEDAYYKVTDAFLTQYLQPNIENPSQKEKSEFVHGLKGAAANIGAVKLFSLCEQLEQQLREADVSIDVLLKELVADILILQKIR